MILQCKHVLKDMAFVLNAFSLGMSGRLSLSFSSSMLSVNQT